MADGQEIVGNNGTENRALTVRGNPDKTIPYRYKPGQSGNPGGRPKRKPIQDELEKVFEENPELARAGIGMKNPQGRLAQVFF